MSNIGKTAKLINEKGDIMGNGNIFQEDYFTINNIEGIMFIYKRFDRSAFNILNKSGDYVGILRETSLNRFNQIVGNSVVGYVIFS